MFAPANSLVIALAAVGLMTALVIPTRGAEPKWTDDRIAIVDDTIRGIRDGKLAVEKELAAKLGIELNDVRGDLELLMRREHYRNHLLPVPAVERELPDPNPKGNSAWLDNPKIGEKASLAQVQALLDKANDYIHGTNGQERAEADNLAIAKERRDWLTKPRPHYWWYGLKLKGTIPYLRGKLNEHVAGITRQGRDGVLLEHLGPGDDFDKLDKLADAAHARLAKAATEYRKALDAYRKDFPAVEVLITASQSQLPRTIRMEEAVVAKLPAGGKGNQSVALVHYFGEQSGGLLDKKPGDPVWFDIRDSLHIRTGTDEAIDKFIADWQKNNTARWDYWPHPVSRVLSIHREQCRTIAHARNLTAEQRDEFLKHIYKEVEGPFGKPTGQITPTNFDGPLHYKGLVRPLPKVAEKK